MAQAKTENLGQGVAGRVLDIESAHTDRLAEDWFYRTISGDDGPGKKLEGPVEIVNVLWTSEVKVKVFRRGTDFPGRGH